MVKGIVVAVIETLRWDHVSSYGYPRETTPSLDTLAKEGVIFEQAISVASRTWQSCTSILTGLYPHHHGVRHIGDKPLSPEIPTLPQLLEEAGWMTFGRTAQLGRAGLGRGFRDFDRQKGSRFRTANRLQRALRRHLPEGSRSRTKYPDVIRTEQAIQWLREHARDRFFIFLHYLAPHWPYKAPPPFEEMFDPCDVDSHAFRKGGYTHKRVHEPHLSESEIEHAIAHYDGAIRFIDSQIEHLAASLSDMNLWEDTVLIVTADHGESLGERDYFFEHGDYVYEPLIRVPLIMKGADLPQGLRSSSLVQTLDVCPTIMELAGLPLLKGMDGVSLLPLFTDENQRVREFAFAESGRDFYQAQSRYMSDPEGKHKAVRTENWKLIYIPRHVRHKFELYHVKEDPYEEHDLFGTHTAVAESLQEAMSAWIYDQQGDGRNWDYEMDPAMKKRLLGLGYLE